MYNVHKINDLPKMPSVCKLQCHILAVAKIDPLELSSGFFFSLLKDPAWLISATKKVSLIHVRMN